MLAARRTLRLSGHSATRLAVVAAAAASQRRATDQVPRRHDDAPGEGKIAATEVLDEDRE